MLPVPEDSVVSGKGLGKTCPGGPGSALQPFPQEKGSRLLPNWPENKLFSNPKSGVCLILDMRASDGQASKKGKELKRHSATESMRFSLVPFV